MYLGEPRGGVHHGLLVAGLVIRQMLPVFIQRLAQSGDVAVAEYAEDGGNEPLLHAVALAVLHGKIPDHRLRRGQPDLIAEMRHDLLLRVDCRSRSRF